MAGNPHVIEQLRPILTIDAIQRLKLYDNVLLVEIGYVSHVERNSFIGHVKMLLTFKTHTTLF